MDLQSEAEMPVEPTKPVDVKKLGITKDRYSCKECKSAFQSRRHVLNHVSLKHGVVNHAEQDMMINVKIMMMVKLAGHCLCLLQELLRPPCETPTSCELCLPDHHGDHHYHDDDDHYHHHHHHP